MRNTRKPLIALLAVALVAALGVGATVAWLSDKTAEVKNTFTVGKVDITLTETPIGESNPAEGTKNSYKLIPGTEYKKDPKITVEIGSEDCYLFVKFEQKDNPSTYLEYTSSLTTENGWTKGSGTIPDNVWYREVKATDTPRSWELLVGNKITVSGSVTNANMADAAKAELVYTAYAIQKANFDTPELAWAEASK